MSIQLAPDIEAGLRAEADARGVSVDALLREALAAYRQQLNGPRLGARRVRYTDRTAEVSWVSNPDPQFIGKWVVLDGAQVLASGPTAKAVYDEAKSKGIEVPFVVYVSPHRDEPFAGGWLD